MNLNELYPRFQKFGIAEINFDFLILIIYKKYMRR